MIVYNEMKSLTEHLTMFVPDADGFKFDWVRALASFTAVEHGLVHATNNVHTKHCVFLQVHSMRGDTVTRNLTKVLGNMYPRLCCILFHLILSERHAALFLPCTLLLMMQKCEREEGGRLQTTVSITRRTAPV